jgi:LysR family transcriptional regulator, glycine cleavage system transcriptional activator
MVRPLPPLNALRAFEAAARTGGFAAAARELGVTPAAVSQQVASLELQLGVPLFRRLARGIALTDAGQAYLPGLEAGFATLVAATRTLRARPRGGRLTVSTLPSFAQNWLLPRLPKFQVLYPEIDVVLRTEMRLVDLARDAVDIAVRYAVAPPANAQADRLANETIFMCASPGLVHGKPADLRRAILLHDAALGSSEPRLAWAPWLALLGLGKALADRGPGFSDSGLLYAAARLGQGVAIGRSVPLEDDLAAGRLVKLFDIELPSRHAYWVVGPKSLPEDPRAAAFRAWILAA